MTNIKFQVCSIDMILEQFDQETVELIPDTIIMKSPKELTQYFIQTWSLRYRKKSKLEFRINSNIYTL